MLWTANCSDNFVWRSSDGSFEKHRARCLPLTIEPVNDRITGHLNMRFLTFFRLRGTKRILAVTAVLLFVATWTALGAFAYVYFLGVPANDVILKIPVGPRRAAKAVFRAIGDASYLPWAFRGDSVPVYRIEMDSKDLAQLNSFPEGVDPGYLPEEAQNAQPAKFRAGGKSFDAKVRYRGETSPHFLYKKKSWRVTFEGDERLG